MATVKLELTVRQAQALCATIDMVLAITGDIKKGDPDFEPVQRVYNKTCIALMSNNHPLANRSAV